MRIQILPAEVVDLIAAGEVIDSLSAVVRELVENALDAGATRISISLLPDLWQVQVSDNGKGMTLEDLRVCAAPHSTSKICTSEDLWNITSLGFRGEALHSISQVSDLTICSRLSDRLDAVGWRVNYLKGEAIEESASAIAPGTIVTVTNLFSSLPVRRRGLPPVAQQLKAIQKLIQYIALAHPTITWQVKQNNQPWFHISPGVNAQHILPQFLRKITTNDLRYLREIGDSDSSLELVLGLPDRAHRYKPDWIKVAVNGRVIRNPELEQTIIAGMTRTLPRDRYPIAFLHLHLNPEQIDWNRHPAKEEIYLHSLGYWQEQVSHAIDKSLRLNDDYLPSGESDRRIKKVLKVAESSASYNPGDANPLSDKLPHDISKIKLKAIAQVNQTYIIVEHASGLWIVEQHIAHERILFEQLQDQWSIVPLATPIVLNNLRPSQLQQLERLGLDIEPFGEEIWAIRNAPAMLATRDDCQAALIELSWGGDLETAQVATACRSAIRNGTPLTKAKMQEIIDRWQITRNPRTCPHGRPIYLSLEESTLARFFRRNWVIGKSHGI
ncbi:MAG: DNA mismatch repair endonuclease MutL [Xenococcus sp. (in: cyanobacteria)]